MGRVLHIDGLPETEIHNIAKLSAKVLEAYNRFSAEEEKKLAGEPHDCRYAQTQIDAAESELDNAIFPKNVLLMAIEILLGRIAELERPAHGDR